MARATLFWLAGMVVVTAAFVYVAAQDLTNFPPVSEDDAWVMSASYKLAMQGTFGSDLYPGFFNADNHYYISLPGLYVLQALSFWLFGAGIAQARLPVLFSGIAVLWLVCDLTRRWYGPGVSLLTAVLLLIWRSNLIGVNVRPPLLQVSQNGRYDVVALAFIWLTVWLLDRLQRHPNRKLAFAVGAAAAAATLTQFFGAFVLPLVMWSRFRRKGERQFWALNVWLVAGFFALVLPYAIYVLSDLDAFAGQAQLIQGRTALAQPAFYVSNLTREPQRFAWLLRRLPQGSTSQLGGVPWGQLLLLLGLVPALTVAMLAERARVGRVGLLGGYLLIVAAGLALVDSTKAPLYAIVLVPALALTFAVACGALWLWLRSEEGSRPRKIAVSLVVLGVVLLALADGVLGLRRHLQDTRRVSAYMEVGERIESGLAPGAMVLGSARWWWALQDYPYLSINNLWAQWRAARSDGLPIPFSDLANSTDAGYMVVNNNVRGNINQYP